VVDPELRGRVMGLYMLVFIGGTPFGSPAIGAITTHFGPRVGMAVCGAIPVLAALLVAVNMRHASATTPGTAPRRSPQPR
jgi:MFS family permease